MDIMEAKQLVIKAGIEVVEYGLIARTWGNISCRVDDKRFVITPSGRPYETLTPDEIVVVNIDVAAMRVTLSRPRKRAFMPRHIVFAPRLIS